MNHQRDLSCYRVPMRLGERQIAPIVAATSPEEALERAQVLGEDLFKKAVPWAMDRGVSRPAPDSPQGLLSIGDPLELHVAGRNHP